jgi:hypothetical protein
LLLAACHVFLPLAASNFSSDALPLLSAGAGGYICMYIYRYTERLPRQVASIDRQDR